MLTLLSFSTAFLAGYFLGTLSTDLHHPFSRVTLDAAQQPQLPRPTRDDESPSAMEEGNDNSCGFSLVYNKPPKTGSTTIRNLMMDWANRTNRPAYRCANLPLDNAVVIHECLPDGAGPCAVLGAHLVLSENMMNVIQRKMSNFKLFTTTRYPAHRIISQFMQSRQLVIPSSSDSPSSQSGAQALAQAQAEEEEEDDDDDDDDDVIDGEEEEKKVGTGGVVKRLDYDVLRFYLKALNPWRLHNFHTGETRSGTCPLTHAEMTHIFSTVTRYDIVIDPNLPDESNAILRHLNLFTIPPRAPRLNVRHSSSAILDLPPDVVSLLRNVSCVEVELHKAMLLRMASLYESATGRPCIRHGPRLLLTSCLEDKERQLLNSTWLF